MNQRAIATKASDLTRESRSQKKQHNLSHFAQSHVEQISFLHKTIGNQAIERLFKSGVIQAKLKIGQPDDIYEQEADRVAEQVMRMPEPPLQRQAEKEEEEEELIQTKPLAEQITPLVQRQVEEEEEEEEPIQTKLIYPEHPILQRQEEEPEEEETLQAKESSGQASEVAPNLESHIHALKGGGQPLPKSTRTFFEPRFGYNFSHVRVHNNSEANQLARTINAKAFTVGHNIVFGSGQYAPGTSRGKRLLGHELTHVVQQNNGSKASSMFQNRKNLIQRSKASNDILKILYWPSSLLISLLNKGVKAVVYLYNYIKNKSPWIKKAVSFLLCTTAIGRATVGILKKHPVYRFKSHSLKRQYYKDPAMTIKKGGVKILKALGYFNPNTGDVCLKDALTNAIAASTLVHEATHGKQWEQHTAHKRKYDLAKWEYEAHIKEEKFKIIHGIQPKHPSFRKLKRVKGGLIWVIYKPGIIKWVNKVYGIKQYFKDWDEKVVGKKGPVGPWSCSK